MGNRKLRFAVFGLGDFGPELSGYIAEVAEVVAICDPNPEARARFQETTGLEVAGFDDHQQLLAEVDIDAVAVISPNFTHQDIAVAAARAGKHVYCEKPMATKVSECWEMVRACQSANVRLMVGHNSAPPWARMIELRERLGEVVAITSCLYHDARPYDFRGWWTREAQCGGTMAIAGVHVIDWMRAMCGDVAAVRAVAGSQIDTRYDFPDTLHVSLDFRSGARANLNVSFSYPVLKFREAAGPLVVCREGGMRMVPTMDYIDLYHQHENELQPQHERFDDLGFDHAFRREIGDFVRWITDGIEPCLTWIEGLRCVEVIEAVRNSAKQNGAIVELPLYPELEPS